MPVAAQLAARYSGRGVAAEDLEQVAYLALVKAVRGYDYASGRDFLSYAVPTMRGELRKHFRDLGWTIRPPRRIQDAQRRISGCESVLYQRLGRAPRPTEIAEHLDLDLDTVVEALAAQGLFTPMSLDSPISTESSLGDELGEDEDGYRAAEARAMLEPLLPLLSERERVMLDLRFFRNATQAEIGRAVGLSQMQVSRLLSALMARLREELG